MDFYDAFVEELEKIAAKVVSPSAIGYKDPGQLARISKRLGYNPREIPKTRKTKDPQGHTVWSVPEK